MRNQSLEMKWTSAILAAGLLAVSGIASAAAINVPGAQATIAAALGVAKSGDEIRVANTYTESSTNNLIAGRAITIRSYDAAYTTPTPGAQWMINGGAPIVTNGLIILNSGAAITVDGFSKISTVAANFILVPTAGLGTGNTITLTNCTFDNSAQAVNTTVSSIRLYNSANSSVTVTGCNFIQNGACLVSVNITGTNTFAISNCTFTSTSAAGGGTPFELRGGIGSHTANFSGCTFSATGSNNPIRNFAFFDKTGSVTQMTVNYDRCRFNEYTGTNAPIAVNGNHRTAGAGSFCNITATNCIFDLHLSNATAAAMTGLNQSAATMYTANLAMKHCTVFLGNGAAQSGIFKQVFAHGAYTVQNCIIDGGGEGIGLLDNGGGTITASNNLFDVGVQTSGSNVASITSTGVVTGSPLFVNPGTGDFHLQAGSNALDVGANLGISVDFDGNPRNVGGAPDLGAYEGAVGSSAAAPQVNVDPATWSTSTSAAWARASQGKRPMLVMFYTERAAPYQHLREIMMAEPTAARTLARFECVRVDANQPLGGTLTTKFKVQRVPCIVLMGPDGTETSRFTTDTQTTWATVAAALAQVK